MALPLTGPSEDQRVGDGESSEHQHWGVTAA